ncbi:uncharacterized protein N7459_004810 [Penicillium hispanicum]|uniref:uncharacterized protein n=1 Tax=Penicillium hispanicum TaxID=1080232 RepID=UPI00254238BB|nr:uncharacterized protein N7459_004810 [Penicillium hispanicum]KAJ5585010.1 hypothetical protein N7459_004810 [Penicillium hispanicum]
MSTKMMCTTVEVIHLPVGCSSPTTPEYVSGLELKDKFLASRRIVTYLLPIVGLEPAVLGNREAVQNLSEPSKGWDAAPIGIVTTAIFIH